MRFSYMNPILAGLFASALAREGAQAAEAQAHAPKPDPQHNPGPQAHMSRQQRRADARKYAKGKARAK
jgi:hypothetical protein